MNDIQNILDDIQTVLEIGIDFSDDVFVNELHELKQKLEENKFYLVVTGLFKRGKSSVINTLLGKNIAPVSVTPVTAIITIFEYSKNIHCEVIFKDNQKKEIMLDEINLYVAEEENPENIKNVSQVKVYCDSEILKNCNIVDTPGLGSVFAHNSETTYSYIPKIDAALFILSADIPISKTDAEFLNEIKSIVPQVIYVLNKTDLLSEKQLKKLISFNKKIIADITLKNESEIVILPVSCKLAKENIENGNFYELKKYIEKIIEENKTAILSETGKNRLRNIANDLRQLLLIKMNTLQIPVKNIEEKQNSLMQSIETMNETRQEFDLLIKGQLDKIIDKNLLKVEKLLDKLSEQVQKEIVMAINNLDVIDNNSINEISEKTSLHIVSQLEKIKENTEQELVEEFNNLLIKYQKRSQSFLNEFSKMLNELFGISFNILAEQFDLKVYTSFYFLNFVDGQSIVPKLSGLYRILPKTFRKLKYIDICKKNAEILIEVNKGRIKSDIIYKVNESFRRFVNEEEKQINLVYNRINRLLNEAIVKKTESEMGIEDDLKQINCKIEILEKII